MRCQRLAEVETYVDVALMFAVVIGFAAFALLIIASRLVAG